MSDERKNSDKNKDYDDVENFSASMTDLEKQLEEKEEDIIVPDFEDETKSLDEFETTEKIVNKDETEQVDLNSIDEFERAEEIEKRKLKEKYIENSKKLNTWEELDEKNDIVKKYIVYVDKENIEAIDNLTVDERNAFINSAIKTKFEDTDIENTKRKKDA